MYNRTLQNELEGHAAFNSPPLCWWRSLDAVTFIKNAEVVEAAVASIAAVSRVLQPDLVNELTTAVEEERARVWNEIAIFYMQRDAMQLGLCAEIAGSAAALSASVLDPLGLVLLLNMLSQPYTTMNPAARLATGATWLGERGALLNRTTMAEVDWAAGSSEVVDSFDAPYLFGEEE